MSNYHLLHQHFSKEKISFIINSAIFWPVCPWATVTHVRSIIYWRIYQVPDYYFTFIFRCTLITAMKITLFIVGYITYGNNVFWFFVRRMIYVFDYNYRGAQENWITFYRAVLFTYSRWSKQQQNIQAIEVSHNPIRKRFQVKSLIKQWHQHEQHKDAASHSQTEEREKKCIE